MMATLQQCTGWLAFSGGPFKTFPGHFLTPVWHLIRLYVEHMLVEYEDLSIRMRLTFCCGQGQDAVKDLFVARTVRRGEAVTFWPRPITAWVDSACRWKAF